MEPSASPEPAVPTIAWDLPHHEAESPARLPETPALVSARASLERVIRAHALDPGNPWAIQHAMLALGGNIQLKNGRDAVDWLFEEYALPSTVAGEDLIAFPAKREVSGRVEAIRIEPHTDLLLKGLTEAGVSPARVVSVAGKPYAIGALYRESLYHTWVDGNRLWTTSWDDVPWTLQGLSAWAPQDLAWTSEGGHPMDMDRLTSAVVHRLHDETQFLRDGLESGIRVEKEKQGIFAYTCGGAHLIQGAAFAVARGFGTPEDRLLIEAEVPALFYRFDIEVDQVDLALQQRPEYRTLLLSQRMKFLGHFLETTHKLAAMGIFQPTRGQEAVMARAAGELVATVVTLERLGVFDHVSDLEGGPQHQLYLDLVGDSCHALRGFDLATGRGKVAY